MRLTLRTLLAYLDDILEPGDFQDISKKISESEFATTLVQRTRDVTRRLRLGAPKLWGRGMGLDPNTVAEYLDNTLAAERVPDFEKVCLESDVHLAEVTASHQILTLVLGEPAHVDPALRRRLYHIGSERPLAAESVAPAAPLMEKEHHAPPPPLPSSYAPARQKPVVPDYLRESAKSRWRTMAAMVALLVVVCAAIVMAIGPQDLIKLVRGPATEPAAPAVQAPVAAVPAPPASEPQPGMIAANSEPTNSPPSIPPVGDQPAPPPSDVPPPSLQQPTGTLANEPGPSNPGPSNPGSMPPGPGDGGPAAGAGGTIDTSAVTVAPTPQAPPGPAARPKGPDNEGDGVGRLMSDDDVLLHFDPSGASWRRLAARAPLSNRARLLALPTFRPTIILSSGVTVQLVPETMVELDGADGDAVQGINVQYGRLVLQTTGKADVQLRLQLGDRQGKLVFGNADTTVAVEVRRYTMPGVNPETQPSPPAIDLYCTNGQVRWVEGVGEPHNLKAPMRLIVAAYPGESGEAGKEFPKWIAANQLSPIDERASRALYRVLDEQSSPLLKLKEQAVDRRFENRSLAVRCLAHVGQFEEFVDVLNDPEQQSAWVPYLEAVEAALARGPEMAGKIRVAFDKKTGEKGAELYRMLWGYSASDLESGGAMTLVEYLDHEDLPFRVLSFWNLKNITGSTLTYRPELPPIQRKAAVQRWRDRLREGQIVPKAPVQKKPGIGPTDALPG